MPRFASPFLAHYGKVFEEPSAFDEVAKQILLMDKHGYDAKTGLYYHAWDETRSRPWANKQTGQSPNFWGRAVGWYAMALVDSLDFFSPTHPEVEHINEVLRKVADGIVKWQDPKTGLWWQVLDQGDRKGNYQEATASAMFVYTLAKGINRGYLPREKYLPALLKGYEGILRDFIRQDPDNSISLTRCCQVAGLDFANSSAESPFVHPVVRAILIHFMIGYDHPFVDGNGRTARALFYWSMLRSGFWMTEYFSISSILRKAPSQYVRSYLHTESDDGDTTLEAGHEA